MTGTETLHLLWRQLLLLFLVVVPSQQVTVQKYVRTTLPTGLKLDPQFKVEKKEKCCCCSAAAGKDTLEIPILIQVGEATLPTSSSSPSSTTAILLCSSRCLAATACLVYTLTDAGVCEMYLKKATVSGATSPVMYYEVEAVLLVKHDFRDG